MSDHPKKRPQKLILEEVKKNPNFRFYTGLKRSTRVLYLFFEVGEDHGRALYELVGGDKAMADTRAEVKLLFTFHETTINEKRVVEFFNPNGEIIPGIESLVSAAQKITL